MATEDVITKPNNDSITLSVDTGGMRATTSITINDTLYKTLQDSFTNQYIGTNQSLNGATIYVVTSVLRYPATVQSSVVVFELDGAVSIGPDPNPYSSSQNFDEGSPAITHLMEYDFR